MLERITIKAHIVTFGRNKYCQTKARNLKLFHKHYLQNDHNGIYDRKIKIVDLAETLESLSQKELYWYHKLKTYALFGLNEHDVYAEKVVFPLFFFSSPVSVLFVISVLFVVIVLIIVKNDHSCRINFLNIF